MKPAPTKPASLSAAPVFPSDQALVLRIQSADDSALKALMDRYDRLVRFRIFQLTRQECAQDPQWLDSLASSVWNGFVQSIRRIGANPPDSVSTYLLQICRNQVVSALRTRQSSPSTNESFEIDTLKNTPSVESADQIVARMDQLVILQECVSDLLEADKVVISQLVLILERRWTDAAGRLGMSESTLRSKWKQISDQLRKCMERKSGSSFAPEDRSGDS